MILHSSNRRQWKRADWLQRLLLIFFALLLSIALPAQKESKKVRNMRDQKSSIQKNIKKNEKVLKQNKKEQQQRQRQIANIENQIQARINHIHALEERIDSVERGVKILEGRLDSLNVELEIKKARYAQALRYERTQRLTLSPTVFVLAGNTPTEMLRRARYAKQYATYQQRLGEAVMSKRNEALTMQHQLLLKKDELNRLLQDVIKQRKQLNADRQHQQNVLKGLVKTEKDLDRKLKKQRKEMAELDRKIEERIAYEIEQARKRAEAERKRREEAERKRRAAQGKSQGTGAATSQGGATKAQGSGTTKSRNSSWLTSEERALNGSFEQNKGRLLVPITGSYYVSRGFGKYTPDGVSGVTLDNKGVDYTGQAGARARAIYDGVVTAIVDDRGAKHVLIRHGAYISAYLYLSNVIVRQGQKVHTGDLLGAVARNHQGAYTMQLQLRRERTLLNPTVWIGR